MNAVSQIGSAYVAHYHNVSSLLPGGELSWLNEMRKQALARFSNTGFPSPREEEWKYTNVSPIEKKMFKPSIGESGQVDREWLAGYRLRDAWSLVFVDGCFSHKLSFREGLPKDVIATHMGDALARFPERVRSYLGRAADRESHGFISFNTAYFSDGAFICISPNTVLEKPIQIIHVATRDDTLANTRSLVIAQQGAQGCVVETYLGASGTSYLTAAVIEVALEENAHLDVYKLQSEADKAYHFGGTYVSQDRHAAFRHDSFSFGGLLVRNEIHADLDHAADCLLNGLYLGTKRQHVDNHTRINHLKPRGTSREVYKGILDQRARGVFQGRVVVHPDAQKTDSEMNNRNLLLSADAEVDTKPQLEIYADDVKCAHGVTVGQLDEESVFYLRSRCVDEETARNMLTFAFANDMVEKIGLENLRPLVQDQLLAVFPQIGIRREWL
ncbi:MAG: Fe-S cluster assembly protein SufD [Pseudomonadota bacterium]